jgi:hypothetical protein
LYLTTCLLLTVTACGSHQFGSVGAENLDQAKITSAESETDFNLAKAALQKVVADSQLKCNTFMASVVAKETNTNTYLDIGTTIASAAATAIAAPLSAVHTLTATSAVLSGTKTAIDSDYFAKATAGNYAQALQGTYFAQIAIYSSDLGNATVPQNETVQAWTSGEIPKNQNIHFSCALGPAQSSISAKLATAQSTNQVTQATVTLTVAAATGHATGPGTLSITPTAPPTASFKTPIPAIPVQIQTGDPPSKIATNIVSAINSSMSSAGINTITAKGGSSAGSVVISSNSSDNVQWPTSPSISGATGITVKTAGVSSATPTPAGPWAAPAPGPVSPDA